AQGAGRDRAGRAGQRRRRLRGRPGARRRRDALRLRDRAGLPRGRRPGPVPAGPAAAAAGAVRAGGLRASVQQTTALAQSRRALARGRRGAWRAGAGALLAVLVALPLLTDRGDVLNLLFLVYLSVCLGQSWNVLAGFAGQVNLGHAAFFGVGAL